MPHNEQFQIGQVLVDSGLITSEQLGTALKAQATEGGKLGEILVHLGYITDAKFFGVLSQQLEIPFVDLKNIKLDPELVKKIPERIARRYKVIMLEYGSNGCLVGMSDPTDVLAYDEVSQIFGSNVRIAIVKEADLINTLDLTYRRTADISSFATQLKKDIGGLKSVIADEDMSGAESAPVAKLLDSIFEDAVQMGASDIHIEPNADSLRIRQRVDGVLNENIIHGKEIIAALVLRIKLIAKLNISERRLPQDGRIQTRVRNRVLDVRVSTLPMYYGESVVMRLLDQTSGILNLNQLGIPPTMLERFIYMINRPSSMILVTGPTGSGKSTTLYSALNFLNSKEKNIITIEDPIEYTLPRINQVQVNSNIDLTFSSVLRAALRQDPDIIMVGEMRDKETVEIGLRSSITGHLVLSTLHTNDAVSSAIRLLDMGSQGFLVASALRGIIAQRLVRKNCEACVAPYTPTKQEFAGFISLLGARVENVDFKQGVGCAHCNHSGYKGRIGVYELLELTPELADTLREQDTAAFTRVAFLQENYRPLTLEALDYAKQGITSLQEIFRIGNEVQGIHRAD